MSASDSGIFATDRQPYDRPYLHGTGEHIASKDFGSWYLARVEKVSQDLKSYKIHFIGWRRCEDSWVERFSSKVRSLTAR